ncbi:MAG: hypothetical protein WKF47_00960 [Geodermatophilaceae bacterium]
MAGAKHKVTLYLDPEVLRAARVRAARVGKRDSEVVEEALRAHLGVAALDQAQSLSTLSEDEALELAYAELAAARRTRR